jgi:hypothetical protein
MAGLSVFLVAGAGFRLRGFAAQLLLPLFATHASLRLRVNLLPRSLNSAHTKKHRPPKGDRRIFLVAGARLSNYMQIKVEPFPLFA